MYYIYTCIHSLGITRDASRQFIDQISLASFCFFSSFFCRFVFIFYFFFIFITCFQLYFPFWALPRNCSSDGILSWLKCSQRTWMCNYNTRQRLDYNIIIILGAGGQQSPDVGGSKLVTDLVNMLPYIASGADGGGGSFTCQANGRQETLLRSWSRSPFNPLWQCITILGSLAALRQLCWHRNEQNSWRLNRRDDSTK